VITLVVSRRVLCHLEVILVVWLLKIDTRGWGTNLSLGSREGHGFSVCGRVSVRSVVRGIEGIIERKIEVGLNLLFLRDNLLNLQGLLLL
jgi:hypothetical protein